MESILVWLGIFYLTKSKPHLRSYLSSLFLTFTGVLGFWYPSIAYLGNSSAFGYYLIDIVDCIRKRDLLFFLHHGLTLLLIFENFRSSEVKYISLYGALMNLSSIFYGWKEMSRNPELYKFWYPKISSNQARIIFGILFILSRIIIGIPYGIYILNSLSWTTRLGIILTFCFNLNWTLQIFLKILL